MARPCRHGSPSRYVPIPGEPFRFASAISDAVFLAKAASDGSEILSFLYFQMAGEADSVKIVGPKNQADFESKIRYCFIKMVEEYRGREFGPGEIRGNTVNVAAPEVQKFLAPAAIKAMLMLNVAPENVPGLLDSLQLIELGFVKTAAPMEGTIGDIIDSINNPPEDTSFKERWAGWYREE